MASREADKRLKEIYDNGGKTYSISRLNTIHQCEYQTVLNYIDKVEKSGVGIYSNLGTAAHDSIEAFIHGEKSLEDIQNAIIDELDDLEMLGITFPLDRNGNTTIRDNWLANMIRFSEEFKYPSERDDIKNKITTEDLLILPVGDNNYMIGYADAYRFNEDGTITLIDWKTSSQFDKTHTLSAGRQLIVYKLALEELGYEVRDCCWCMLKYCETTWLQKNGKPKSKVSEWRNLIKDLKSPIEKTLIDLGYGEVDIECMIENGLDSNSWSAFPQPVQDKFKTTVYYRYYDIDQDLIDETLEYIDKSIKRYEELEQDKESASHCDINKESYFCCNLCDFGGKSGKCKYWVEYCDKFDKDSNNNDEYSDLF